MTTRLARIATIAVAIAFTLTYLVLAVLRLRYPFELEWMEGSMVDHVQRVLQGQLLYVKPSIDWAPYLYTPLFYYVSAGVALLTGIGFVPLRLVSIAASLGSFALIYVIVRRETGSRGAGVLGVGVFAATYRLSGAWFDIGRVDSLLLVLVLGAVALVRFTRTPRTWAVAGALLILAFLSKQVGLTMAVGIAAYAVAEDRRRGAVLAAISLGGIALATVLLEIVHGGWFSFYVFDIPGSHAIERRFFIEFWTRDLFGVFGPASAVACAYAVERLWAARREGSHALFYPFILSGVLVGAWLGRLHTGGWENVLIPAYAWLAVGCAIGVHAFTRATSPRRFARMPGLPAAAGSALLLTQFALLAYNPIAQLPTKESERAGWEFIDFLRRTPGEVWVFDHGYLPRLAGKHPHAPSAAIWDILRAEKGSDAARQLAGEIQAAVQQQRFTMIVLDTQREFPTTVEAAYLEDRMMFTNPDVFWPLTGFQKRPDFVFLPNPKGPEVTATNQAAQPFRPGPSAVVLRPSSRSPTH